MPVPLERLEGKYEILSKMREGGMGAVYKVRHKLLDEIRVIKVMRPSIASDEVVRARFLREAQMAVRLRHPNLAQIFDFTVDDEGFAFIVMEFVDGFDLHQMMRTIGAPSVPLAVELVRQSLSVLGYLHRRGVVHRDVSPDNLLLTRDEDGGPLVKLIDLGIAKVAEGEDRLTAAGSFVGKVRYSSPEHFRGEEGAAVDARSDLYSLGVVLYELLTGRFPIQGTTVPEIIAGHLLQAPLPFQTSDPAGRVPPALREVVQRAIAKPPADRYGSASDMSAAIEQAVGELPIDPTEVAGLFTAPAEATLRLKVPRPGSTQNHLDRNFQLSRTPAPPVDSTVELVEARPGAGSDGGGRVAATTPDPSAQLRAFLVGAGKLLEEGHLDEARVQLQAAAALDPSSAEVARLLDVVERHDRVEALLQAAHRAMDEGRYDDAVGDLEDVLELDPGRSDVVPRLDTARGAAAAAAERRRRDEELAATVRQIESQLADGILEEAERGLALARKLYGEEPALRPLPALVEQTRAARRRRQAAEIVARATSAMADQDFAAVLDLVGQARQLEPDLPELAGLADAAGEGLRRQAEEQRRQDRSRELVARVERLVEVERFDAARLELEHAVEEMGRIDGAAELESRIERGRQAREQRIRRGEALLDDARRSAREGRLDAAIHHLDDVRAMADDMPDLLEVVAEIEEWLDRRREEERRAVALREAETSIDARLAAHDLDRAERELQVAERLFGRAPSLATLRERFETARREERNRRVEALVRSALGGQASFADVIATLEQALAIDPLSDTVQRLLAETRAAHRRYQQERRARSAATAMREVDLLIAEGNLEAALARLDLAVAEVGSFVEASRLRPRLVQRTGRGS